MALTDSIRSLVVRARTMPRRTVLAIGAAGVVILLGAMHFLGGSSVVEETPITMSHVRIASVAGLSSQAGPLPVTGTVASKSQASLLAQAGGEITSLPRSLGDTVNAGAVIAQFENSSQRAAVVQAQGAYDAAVAALAKVQGTTAQNTSLTSAQAATAAGNAASSARSTLSSTYAALDDAVHAKADTLFINPRSNLPTLRAFIIPDSQLVLDIQNARSVIEGRLREASAIAVNTTAPIDESIGRMVAIVREVQPLLDNLVRAINQAVPNAEASATDIAAYQTMLATARTGVNTAMASLLAAKNAYDAAQGGAQTAANASTSGTPNDIASAQASVKSALGSLQAAQANYEKTIVRAPISGTIVSLPVTRGDYLSPSSPVAEISNPNALEIVAYVTSDDARTIAVGGEALIDGATRGVITFIAPALDPSINKMQVKIGVVGSDEELTVGDTVSVGLSRSTHAATTQKKSQGIVIPIVAAKITPQGPVVFSVSSSSTLEALPIQLGTVLGDKVVVISGLSPEMTIVTDARGLSQSQRVVVDE